jgi:hypothetical protein
VDLIVIDHVEKTSHRELGQMSGGRRVLASRPFYFAIVFWSSYRVTRKLCPGPKNRLVVRWHAGTNSTGVQGV